MRAPWLVVLVAVAAPARLQAQDPRLPDRLGPAVAGQVAAVVDSARVEGLPGEPLIQKALEGASKGADGPRIVQAVRGLRTRLAVARAALRPRASEVELVTGADALAVGVAPEALSRIGAVRRGGDAAVPFATLTFLVQQGAPPAAAAVAVEGLVRRRVTDADLVSLQRQVARDVRAGARPAAALVARARGLGGSAPGEAGP